MAYLAKEKANEFKKQIKAAFPPKDGWKFSMVISDNTTIKIALMAFPKGYNFPTHKHYELNENFLDKPYELKDKTMLGHHETAIFKRISEIVFSEKTGYRNNSDSIQGHHDCSWYLSLFIGKWESPAVAVEKKTTPIWKAPFKGLNSEKSVYRELCESEIKKLTIELPCNGVHLKNGLSLVRSNLNNETVYRWKNEKEEEKSTPWIACVYCPKADELISREQHKQAMLKAINDNLGHLIPKNVLKLYRETQARYIAIIR